MGLEQLRLYLVHLLLTLAVEVGELIVVPMLVRAALEVVGQVVALMEAPLLLLALRTPEEVEAGIPNLLGRLAALA